jgi:transposase-like protein
MGKNVRKKPEVQGAAGERRVSVQMSLPMIDALVGLEEDYFGLCIRSGDIVLRAMLEADRTELCGPKWGRGAHREVVRAGTTRSEVTLGGRRVSITRPRARTNDGAEVSLPTFAWAANRDPLDRATMSAVSAGVSTRGYESTLDPLPPGVDDRSTAKSSVSRRFVAMSTSKLKEWLNAPLEDLDLEAILIDGIHFADHCVLIALGVTAQGQKKILGLHEGGTENAAVARMLLTNLVTRGLDPTRPMLFGIDGSKALRKAIRDVWGDAGVVQRCQVHKSRNVLDHLPEAARPWVRSRLRKAYEEPSYNKAKALLERLSRELEREHPGAAASLREGLEETLTLQRLGLRGALFRTLRSTNAIENLNGSIATYTRNTKRWRGGSMILRWIAAALDHSQPRLRAVRGFSELPKLRAALDREIDTDVNTGVEKAA